MAVQESAVKAGRPDVPVQPGLDSATRLVWDGVGLRIEDTGNGLTQVGPLDSRMLVGLRLIDPRGRRLGRIVGIVHQADGGVGALVSPRFWLLRRAWMVPVQAAQIDHHQRLQVV